MTRAQPPATDVLVIGTSTDPHIDRVLDEMPGDISVSRLDIDRFPKACQLTIDQSGDKPILYLRQDDEELDISSPRVAWFRRLGKLGLSDKVPARYRQFCLGEAEMTLEGVMSLIEPKQWINEYWSARHAANKPYQYAAARQAGLLMPNTLITNNQDRATAWLPASKDSIVKSLHSPLLTRDDSDVGRTFAFTRRLRPEDRELLGDVVTTPCQFQPNIPKAYELRVTSIGDRHVVVKVDATDDEAGREDWRAAAGRCNYTLDHLSLKSLSALSKLMQRLGIVYAASDFVVTPDGDEVFLEANPHGAWLWLDDSIPEAGITRRFSSYMTSLVRQTYEKER